MKIKINKAAHNVLEGCKTILRQIILDEPCPDRVCIKLHNILCELDMLRIDIRNYVDDYDNMKSREVRSTVSHSRKSPHKKRKIHQLPDKLVGIRKRVTKEKDTYIMSVWVNKELFRMFFCEKKVRLERVFKDYKEALEEDDLIKKGKSEISLSTALKLKFICETIDDQPAVASPSLISETCNGILRKP
jgi:hypothetical protein